MYLHIVPQVTRGVVAVVQQIMGEEGAEKLHYKSVKVIVNLKSEPNPLFFCIGPPQ